MARRRRFRRADFTPSYPAKSRADYLRKVKAGHKRDAHLMLGTGRTGIRYNEGPEEETRETRRARSQREEGPLPPWGARTQAPRSRHAARTLDEKIRVAIEKYRERSVRGRAGFLVPDVPFPLIAVGMPKRAAFILTQRAGRQFYIASQEEGKAPQVPLYSRLLSEIGGVLVLSGDKIRIKEAGKYRLSGELVEVTVATAQREQVLFNEHDLAKEVEKSAQLDAPVFLRRLLQQIEKRALVTDTEGSPIWPEEDAPNVEFLFERVSGDETFKVPLYAREHSKLVPVGVRKRQIHYKNLRGVPLSELPSVVARLARRRKREGRRDPIIARTNPLPLITHDQDLILLVQAKIKARELMPVPGQQGKVYWWSKRKGLRPVPQGQAETWLAMAETGDRMRGGLHAAAESAYARQKLEIEEAQENPMASDDYYWTRQYEEGPYGASQSIPAARRNRGRKRGNPQAKAAMELYHSGEASSLKDAWKMVKGNARPNKGGHGHRYYRDAPYDPTVMHWGSELVPGPDYEDRTAIRTALYNGRARDNKGRFVSRRNTGHGGSRGRSNPARDPYTGQFVSNPESTKYTVRRQGMRLTGMRGIKRYKGQAHFTTVKGPLGRGGNWPAALYRRGQFSTQETGGYQPINRRNPGIRHTKNGQPYIITESGKARFISKAEAAGANPPRRRKSKKRRR